MLLGGVFLFGSLAGPLLGNAAKKSLSGKSSILHSLGEKVTKALGRKASNPPADPTPSPDIGKKNLDITYYTPLNEEELKQGKSIQVLVYSEEGREQTLKIKIPPGSRTGQKLRIRGKGNVGPSGSGDLFLHLVTK